MSFDSSKKHENTVVRVSAAGKSYRLYQRPADRLLQFILPSASTRFQDFVALENVSFELRRGEVMGIVGVNGAGKSTLLQLVTGTITPSSGTVETHGRIAAILELGSGFNPEFSGRENIYLNAATLGLDKREIEDRIDSIIDFAGIGPHIEQPVKTYSSGMVVRLAFSIATSVDPDILIIDEALSVGDGAFRRRSFDRIMQIKERGTTILFCSHVLYHVETFCDRALWLHRGKVQKQGPVSQVLEPYQEFIDAYEKDINIDPESLSQDGKSPALTSRTHPDEGHPTGGARINTINIQLDGQGGDELRGTSLVSRLDVEIDFSSDPSLPSPSAALVLSTESGKILGSSLSHTQGIVFSRSAAGSGVARISIDRIPLNKGRYRVGVYLFCERGLHGYAMADPAAYIQLEHAGNESGSCMFYGAWSGGNDTAHAEVSP